MYYVYAPFINLAIKLLQDQKKHI
uniref:Uncharacterized protein n=1 Tax=Arundo donax TaxID=35708 RepID=A0A0A8Y1Q1_ARUDO